MEAIERMPHYTRRDEKPDELERDHVSAYQETPGGAMLRLRGYGTRDEWTTAVEIVDTAGNVSTLLETGDDTNSGLLATQFYNRLVDELDTLEELL